MRQRSQKGKSIHFLQNIESGLPFHPQRDTQIHSYSFCCALSSIRPLFLSLSPALFLCFSISPSPSFTPSPVPLSLNSLPFLLTSKKNLHLGAFRKHLTPVKFKGEICTISYACFRLFPRYLGGRGYRYGGCKGSSRWSLTCVEIYFLIIPPSTI